MSSIMNGKVKNTAWGFKLRGISPGLIWHEIGWPDRRLIENLSV